MPKQLPTELPYAARSGPIRDPDLPGALNLPPVGLTQGRGLHSAQGRDRMPLWPPRRRGIRIVVGPPPEDGGPTTASHAQPHRRAGPRRQPRSRRVHPLKPPRQGTRTQAPAVDEVSEVIQKVKIWGLEEGWQALLRRPDMLDDFVIGFLAKELGVKPPKLPTWEEDLIAEVRADPEYRRGEIERIVEGRRLSNLLEWSRKLRQFARTMGLKRGADRKEGGAELARTVKEFMAQGGLRDLVQTAAEAYGRRSAALQSRPEIDPTASTAARMDNAGNTTEGAVPPPRPASRRPPGPVRRSVGVPPGALGLLGVGQDDTFIDAPLI